MCWQQTSCERSAAQNCVNTRWEHYSWLGSILQEVLHPQSCAESKTESKWIVPTPDRFCTTLPSEVEGDGCEGGTSRREVPESLTLFLRILQDHLSIQSHTAWSRMRCSHFLLHKVHRGSSMIHSIKDEDGSVTSSQTDIVRICRSFTADLYDRKAAASTASQAILSSITVSWKTV